VTNAQLEYYSRNNIIAVEYASLRSLDGHFESRLNLLTAHLNLPEVHFRGRTVLEFGPNGGQNALLLAELGATLTLVEPNVSLHEGIRQLFSSRNLSMIGDRPMNEFAGLKNIYADTIESFGTNEKYDFVVAEGFLHAIPNRGECIRRLCELSRGVVVFTYSCRFGSFFEAIKRVVYKLACETIGKKEELTDSFKLDVAKNLFFDDFSALNTSRRFESWVADVIQNPCQVSQTLDTFEDMELICRESGYAIHGTSPSWDCRNIFRWYKDFAKENICHAWREALSFIIMGDASTTLSKKDVESVGVLTPMLLDFSSGVSSVSIGDIKKSVSELSEVFAELKAFFRLLDANAEDTLLIANYRAGKFFRRWGMPHHYIAAAKQYGRSSTLQETL
jgi:hypothetical protein